MDEPEEQSPAKGSEPAGPSEPGIMIRGADGALYIVTEKLLQPFKVTEEKAKQLTEFLSHAPTDHVSYDLPPNVLRELQSLAKCVGLGIKISFPRKE